MEVVVWFEERVLAGVAAVFCTAAAASGTFAEEARTTTVRGVVRSEATATISSELVARVASLPFRTGQSFKSGDVLVSLDCQRYAADLRAAEAEVKMQQINVTTNRSLLSHRATGTNDLALAEARHAQAVAGADSLRARIAQCTIAAPYPGRVVERLVDVFEIPQANAPMLKIVKTGRLELELIVPSTWAVWLAPDFAFPFTVDETKTKYSARLMQLGAVVDPVSRTMKVTAELLDASHLVRPGMSGTASIGYPVKEPR